MRFFSEAYEAAKVALESGDLSGKAQTLKPKFKYLLAGANLGKGQAAALDSFRDMVKAEAIGKTSGKVLREFAGTGTTRNDRAAALKMFRHLYETRSSGGQTIWCYAPPFDYQKWIFEEVAGADDLALDALLSKENEVYTAQQRTVMADAVQLARSVCGKVLAKLSAKDANTKTVVRRYFGNAASTDAQLDATMTLLSGGFKRIHKACNDGNIVISDEPIDRNKGGWKDWAFIFHSEEMSVIYLQNAWLSKADEVSPSNQSPLYRCARTIIHELSHKQVTTEDIVYGPKGLQVEGSRALTPEYAIHNADSWAYFAIDVIGQLTGPDAVNGKTACKAIRETPKQTLTTA